MAFRIETAYIVPDARSVSKCGFFNTLGLKNKVKKVSIVDAYTVDARISPKQMQKAAELLTNPLVESFEPKRYTLNAKRLPFDFAVEISFLPGVTDNVGHTAKETIADGTKYKFKDGQNVYSSQILFISGRISRQDINKIASSLYNPLIQKAVIKTAEQYKKDGGFKPNLPKVKLSTSAKITKVDLNVSDEELAKLGKLGIKNPDGSRRGPLSLSLDYLKAIRDYFNRIGRQPTDVEIESLAQTWSEHCKHTIFLSPLDEIKDGIFKHYIKRATDIIRKQKNAAHRTATGTGGDFCVSVFKDNSGAIKFDKNFLITHKVETHNTPSALDPFGGAITGIVGVNRDCLGFGLGAKPIINTYGFCLAPPDDKTKLYRDKEKKQPMLSARRIMDGVIAGVNAGGNQSGIPTNSGFLYFDPRFRGKPLVFAGTVGLIPRKVSGKPSHVKAAQPNDLIVMIGGRVGLDGIHGATFSSESLDSHSPATAVQIGDPITQKKFSDAIVREARAMNLYNSITDCGAGGLSSAVGEMAKESNGCEVNLDKVSVKYPGLAPWQIWISESQERMVLSVPPKKWRTFQNLMGKRGVESSIIGKFTKSGKCAVKFKNLSRPASREQTVMDIDLEFLHNGLPIKHLKTAKAKLLHPERIRQPAEESKGHDLKSSISNLLSSSNITSTAFITAQYDHEVQGSSILKPLQGAGGVNADATVTRPVLNSKKGVILSSALYPEYSEINPYYMAARAIDSAIGQAVALGANPDYLALLDNFCWCSSNNPKRLWQLKQAASACFDCAVAFGAPFISGKDSMFNDFKGFDDKGKPIKISIPPTLLISAIGVIDDVTKTISLDAKMPGDIIYLLGETQDELPGGNYPKMNVDASKNLKLYRAFYQCARNNLVASAISVGRGDLAVALSKTAIAGQLGIDVFIDSSSMLFSESPGRIVAIIDPKKTAGFEKMMAGLAFAKIGKVTRKPTITITANDNRLVDLSLKQAEKAYKKTFKNY